MDQQKQRPHDGIAAQEPNANSALDALARCLARMAAEKDYAAYGGAAPDAATPEDES